MIGSMNRNRRIGAILFAGFILAGWEIYSLYRSRPESSELEHHETGTPSLFGPTYVDPQSCPQEIRAIIQKYAISTTTIAECQSEEFSSRGKPIKFIHLAYGFGLDCPSGCIFSHYCAVVEDGKDLPYAFYFNSKENILGSSRGNFKYADKSILTGQRHRLSRRVAAFIKRNRNGAFRWCRLED